MNRRLAAEVGLVRRWLALTVGLGLAAGILVIAQAVLLTHVVNGVFLGHQGISTMWPSLWLLLGAIATRGLLGWLSEVSALRTAIRVKADLRMRLAQHLFRLGPAFLRQEQSGELVNTAYEGIELLEPYLARYLPQVALSALVPLAILTVALRTDLLSVLIFSVTAPVIVIFMILIGKTAQAVIERQWKTMSLLSAHFFDVLRGLTTLKLFNRSRVQATIIARISEDYRKTTMGTLRVAFLSSFVLELMATLGTAMIAVVIGLRLLSGRLSFADGLVILLLAPEFYAPIRALGTQYHASINGVTAADRILDILSTTPLGLDENPGGQKLSTPIGMEFREVNFHYPTPQSGDTENRDSENRDTENRSTVASTERGQLEAVSFSISPGETVAIVGPSGAGKTTIIDLLMGFLRPASGQILVSGVPLRDLSLSWWRSQVAYVPQSSHLFQGSIADNLRMAKRDGSEHEMTTACQLAGADKFIKDLPNGYHTLVHEGGINLSGGQVQRLTLARAFLKNAPVLVLDEPTAHLDVESELAVQAALDHLLKSRTALIVAHRLSTIYRADSILVLQEGRVVAQGRHEDLLRTNSLYRQLLQAYTGKQAERDQVVRQSDGSGSSEGGRDFENSPTTLGIFRSL